VERLEGTIDYLVFLIDSAVAGLPKCEENEGTFRTLAVADDDDELALVTVVEGGEGIDRLAKEFFGLPVAGKGQSNSGRRFPPTCKQPSARRTYTGDSYRSPGHGGKDQQAVRR
jgi:hypothetical protein